MRSFHPARPRRARLALHPLEGRETPAGVVQANLAGGVLTLSGDDQPNDLTFAIEAGQVRLTPDGTTDVGQGPGVEVLLPGTATTLRAGLGGGFDRLAADAGQPCPLPGGVTVDAGEDGSLVQIDTTGPVTLGSLTVKAADGFDTVIVRGGAGSRVAGNVSVSVGHGGSQVTLTNLEVLGPRGVTIAAGDGPDDAVALTGVTGGKPVSAALGNGTGRVTLDAARVGAVSVSARDAGLTLDNSSTVGKVAVGGAAAADLEVNPTAVVNGNVTVKATAPHGLVTVEMDDVTVHGGVWATATGVSSLVDVTLTKATVDGPVSVKPTAPTSGANVTVTGGSTLTGGLAVTSAAASTDLNANLADTTVGGPLRVTNTGKDDVDVAVALSGTVTVPAIQVTGGYGSYLDVTGAATVAGDITVLARTLFGHMNVSGGTLSARSARVTAPEAAVVDLSGPGAQLTLAGGLTVESADAARLLSEAGVPVTVNGPVRVAGKGEATLDTGGLSQFGGAVTVTAPSVVLRSPTGSFNVAGALTVRAADVLDVSLTPGGPSVVQGDAVLTSGPGADSVQTSSRLRFAKNLTIDLKDGPNTLNLPGIPGTVTVGGNLSVAVGAGDDQIDLIGVSVAGRTAVTTGAGADNLVFDGECAFTGAVRVDLGSGADNLSVEPDGVSGGTTTFRDRLTASLGTGNDGLVLGVTGTVAQVVFAVPGSTIDGGPGADTFDPAGSNVTGTVTRLGF
jgi:hypothetical protein